MFSKHEYVIYASEGVCLVKDICPVDFDSPRFMATGDEKTEYYLLEPIGKSGSLIYVPTNSEKLVAKMRRVHSKAEIESAIAAVKGKALPWIDDRKKRAVIYQSVSREMKVDLLLLLVRSLYKRKKELEKVGKKPAFSDLEMLSKCEGMIAGEFAFSLGIPEREVGAYIRKQLGLQD